MGGPHGGLFVSLLPYWDFSQQEAREALWEDSLRSRPAFLHSSPRNLCWVPTNHDEFGQLFLYRFCQEGRKDWEEDWLEWETVAPGLWSTSSCQIPCQGFSTPAPTCPPLKRQMNPVCSFPTFTGPVLSCLLEDPIFPVHRTVCAKQYSFCGREYGAFLQR